MLKDSNGIIYNSIHHAALCLNIGAMTIHRALKNNKSIGDITLKRI